MPTRATPSVDVRYAPYFCEENIWHLCGEPRFAGRDARVTFISNARRACALWAQRAAPAPWHPVIWDYHVVLLAESVGGWEVWDPDTTLAVPASLQTYLDGTFLSSVLETSAFVDLAPRFRLIEAARYREEFSSDRAHMRTPDGRWQQPPPPWEPVIRHGAASFLRWAMMSDDADDVLSIEGLVSTLSSSG